MTCMGKSDISSCNQIASLFASSSLSVKTHEHSVDNSASTFYVSTLRKSTDSFGVIFYTYSFKDEKSHSCGGLSIICWQVIYKSVTGVKDERKMVIA